MKKTLLSVAGLAILFASCKKENVQPSSASSGGQSVKSQVATIIAKAEPALYNEIYNRDPNNKAPEPEVKITKGIFTPLQGDVASGTCFTDPNCICHITVTWPALVTDSTETTEITKDYYAEFTERGEGEIIMNATQPYTIHDLRSVSIKFDGSGKSTVSCKVLE